MPTTIMDAMKDLFGNVRFSVAMTCLAIISLLALLVIAYISYRQRRKITELVKQLEEGEKSAQIAKMKQPVDNGNVIVIKETPASQVWESDECVFYDLGSVSRATSRDALDVDTDEEAEEKGQEDSKESAKDEIREVEGIGEKNSIKSLEDSKMDSGSIEGLTEDIWVGGNDVPKGNKDMISLNDALSEMGPAEDSGNETTSNEDLLCTSGEEVVLTDEETGNITESASEEGDVKKEPVKSCEAKVETTETSVDENED